jgi:hypothetical protein
MLPHAHPSQIERDKTMRDPRCVLQVMKRHYQRYTPEMVEEVCGTGMPPLKRTIMPSTTCRRSLGPGYVCDHEGWQDEGLLLDGPESCHGRCQPGFHRAALEKLEYAEIAAMSMELGLITTLVPALGTLGKPLFKGRVGKMFVGGTVVAGVSLPLAVRVFFKLMGRSVPRGVSVGTSLLVLMGGMILPYA